MYPSSRNPGLKAGNDNKAGESSDVCSTATSDSSSPPAQHSNNNSFGILQKINNQLEKLEAAKAA